jgi:hypothetical protein
MHKYAILQMLISDINDMLENCLTRIGIVDRLKFASRPAISISDVFSFIRYTYLRSQKGDNSFKYGLIKVMHKYAILQMLIRDHAKFYGNQF